MSLITYDFLVYLFKTRNIQSCDAETALVNSQSTPVVTFAKDLDNMSWGWQTCDPRILR